MNYVMCFHTSAVTVTICVLLNHHNKRRLENVFGFLEFKYACGVRESVCLIERKITISFKSSVRIDSHHRKRLPKS